MSPTRPNVVFMTCDDLRPLLACYGCQEMHTPNLDRLAESGVLFERNFSQVPICMASRASFMTGRRPDRNRIYSCEALGKLMPDATTINRHFAAAGYDVMGIGKVYHHEEDNTGQFGEGYFYENHQAFGRGYVTGVSRELIERNSREREARGLGPEDPDNGRGPCTESGPEDEKMYPDGGIAAAVVAKLNMQKEKAEPFFLAVGWRKPHLPFVAPQSYWDLYDTKQNFRPKNDKMPIDMPRYTANYNFAELRNYVDVPYEGPIPEKLDQKLMRGYRACVSFMDAQVGKVLDALEQNGQAENTVVVFMVDHGFSLKEHNLYCKHNPFTVSNHVPLLIRAPGVTASGGRIKGLSENIDVFPTLCTLCGIDSPSGIDGVNQIDWLRNPELGGKEAAFSVWAAEHRENEQKALVGYTVVTDRHRYTEWTHLASGEIHGRELFDLVDDPGETRNLAADPSNDDILNQCYQLIENQINE